MQLKASSAQAIMKIGDLDMQPPTPEQALFQTKISELSEEVKEEKAARDAAVKKANDAQLEMQSFAEEAEVLKGEIARQSSEQQATNIKLYSNEKLLAED